MIHSPSHSENLRLLLPETIWLETEHFEQAKVLEEESEMIVRGFLPHNELVS